ncbi:MAG TPA: peptidase S14 [Ruminococcaceae bacterium]|nr:peptidase S14 [Oscillospiraceae bacterium]
MRKYKHRGFVLSQKDEFVKNPCEEFAPSKEEADVQDELNSEIGSVLINRGGRIIYCLTVIGQIEGHYLLPSSNKTTKYEHVIPMLVSVSQDQRIDGVLIMINTVGGDVEAGLAIAEVIAGIKKPTVSIILGGGHSIGIPLAVAAKKSFVAKSATMTVHAVRTTGLTVGVPQTFEYFRQIQDRITEFIVENSAVDFSRYNELALNTSQLATDVGTILDGEEAVDEGIIDDIGTVTDAIEALCDMIDAEKL